MKLAKVKIAWEKSPSNSVTHYIIAIVDEDDNGNLLLEKTVSYLETEVEFTLVANSSVTISIVASDGLYESKPVSYSLKIGNLMIPEPIGGISVKIVEVIDVTPPGMEELEELVKLQRELGLDNQDEDMDDDDLKVDLEDDNEVLKLYNPDGEDENEF